MTGANFSDRDLTLFFRHLLRVKIRCDRKRLDHISIQQKPVVRKREMFESSFPPFPVHGD